jgi:diguanylate cyclase (GGDEF)-like protein
VTWHKTKPALTGITAAALMCVHVGLNAAFPRANDPISYTAFLICSTWAALVCAQRARIGSLRNRRSWTLVTAAFLLYTVATGFSAYIDMIAHGPSTIASWDDFFYFFSGVPFLLAISSPDDTRLFPLFFWLDVAQAAAVGWLTYLVLFGILPFSRAMALPISVDKLVWLFALEAIALAILGLARWMASPGLTRERRFHRDLAIYLCATAIFQPIYNYLVLKYNYAGVWDVLTDLPFCIFVAVAALPRAVDTGLDERPSGRPILVMVDHGRPVLLGLAVVALSTLVIRQHFVLATSFIVATFLVYGVRSAVLQSQFLQSQAELEKARDRLEDLAMLDGLTGVGNRRSFDHRLETEWRRAQRTHLPVSLLLIDIDRFKNLNDTYGHLVGDDCLIEVARTLAAALNRPADLLARYGGDEFVALMPETDENGARNVAVRMQQELREKAPHPAMDRAVTVSIGGTTWDSTPDTTAEQMVEVADRALYQAKENGRNRIEYCPMSALPQG